MLNPKLNNCVDCTTIPNLINDIDCKLTELAKIEYNNIIFALNLPINNEDISDLINYKRILQYRLCNPDYAATYTLDQIASRIKVLKYR